jgi:uncharacterized membrane protein YeaQ/YmgE (transglycosylase-associated protein family)
MNLLLWIIFGAISGWIASMIMSSGGGAVWDIVMGILGAIIGGVIMNLIGQPGVNGFNLYSILVSVIGACVLIYISRILRRSSY